jgi:hypothetical protein
MAQLTPLLGRQEEGREGPRKKQQMFKSLRRRKRPHWTEQ